MQLFSPAWSDLYSVGIVAVLVGSLVWKLRKRPNFHHRRMLGQSDRSLARIQEMEHPGQVIAYVRKMHPHAVEELVLTAAVRAGHKVRRNDRYTGDCGVDGEIEIDGQWHLVQTKRYNSAINPAHVREFSALCQRRSQSGLFIHVGRTGQMSRDALVPGVRIVSGQRLTHFLRGAPLSASDAHSNSNHARRPF